MPLSIRCPRGHKLNVPSKYAGQTVRCPACQSKIVVPGELVELAKKGPEPPKRSLGKITAFKPHSSQTEVAATEAPAAAPVTAIEPVVFSAVSAPPPLPAVDTAPQTELPAIAFAPDDPAAPVPVAGIVPGANASTNRLVKVLRERNLLTSDLGYRADLAKRHSVYWLAGTQFALALFAALPAFWQLMAAQPAPWVHFVLCLSLVQLGYAVWLALAPDYSSAEVAMFATGVLAGVYAAAMAVCWLTAPRVGGWLHLGSLKMEYGSKPALWCAVIVLLASLTAYLCGHVSYRWRKTYKQLTLGAK